MRTALAVILLALAVSTSAQTEPEYRMEIGGGIGMVSYQGDFNSNLLKEMQPMFSLLAKYRFTPRMALAMNVSYGKLKGSAKTVTSHVPQQWESYTFSNNIWDIGIRTEYNFWPYGTGMEYRGAQRLTPYILLGLGLTVCKPDRTEITLNVPLGAGVKYKVADRLNMALEWAMHITGSDMLDGVKDPYGIKSSGLFKNTDCYSELRLSVTYDIWAKCKTCHNDRD